MKRMGGESQSAVATKYIETLLEIPWNESSDEIKDINLAEKILNQDHTGLKDVK
jgi:ATP-dependent Lon protease